jgi:hypothetical protein
MRVRNGEIFTALVSIAHSIRRPRQSTESLTAAQACALEPRSFALELGK